MQKSQESSTPSPALVIALISIPIFIGALDLTVVSAVLPHVIYDLEIPVQTGLDEAAWVVSGYLLAYTIAMTFMGRLSDVIGRRKVYLLALVIFGLGSYLVAVADGWPTRMVLRFAYLLTDQRPDPAHVALWTLVAARMIQAFGGGAMVPVGMALAGDLYPAAQRAKPLGIIAAVDTSGWVVGHLYGGILTRFFDWRLIFWLNLPVCALAFIIIWRMLAKLPDPPYQGRMDWLGALLIAASLTLMNIGLGANVESGIELSGASGLPPYAFSLIIAALVFLVLFLWRQVKAASPLIPLSLFRRPNFTPANLANLLTGYSLFIAIASVPLFINTLVAETLAQGAWDSGWMLSALTVPMAIAAIPAGWLTVRFGYRRPALWGILIAVLGFVLMAGWRMDTPYRGMIPHLVLTGIGLGLVMTPVAASAINAAPDADRGTASSLVIIFRLVGMTISVSSVATYGVYRANQLSTLWLAGSNDLNKVVQVGMQAAEKVISETFVIAAICAILAFVPIFFLKQQNERSLT
jgi:MFS family permease